MKRLFILLAIFFMVSSGFGATKIGLGYLFTSAKSNFVVNDNDRINSLKKPGEYDSENTFIGELSFTKKYGNTTVKAGTDFSSDSKGLGLSLGRHYNNVNNLVVTFIFDPFSKVYKDPYKLNGDRNSTRVYSYIAKISLQGIMNTNFSINYSLRYSDVSDDKVKYDDLKRDELAHNFSISYKISTLLTGFSVMPEVGVESSNADGESNSYNGYFGGLGFLYDTHNLQVFLKTKLQNNFYDKKDPIFLSTRHETIYSVFLGCTLKGIFSAENMYATLLTGVKRSNSNIGFYDESKIFSGFIVGYEF